MCLSIPGKVIEIKKGEITLDYGIEKRKIKMSLIEDLKIGDYCIVSNKIIIAKLSEEKAKKFIEAINKK